MLADHQPNQRQQEKENPTSSTHELVQPSNAANYHAPVGGFSANPKVPSGSADPCAVVGNPCHL